MFGSRFLLFGALLATIDVAFAVEDARACDDLIVSIVNQTDLDFYKTCKAVDGGLFFIDHEFKGAFELPGVETISEVSSGYLLPKLKGSDRVDDGVTSVSMPDLKNITTGGLLFGYIDNLTSISFPKLETLTGGIGIVDSYKLRNLSFPALTTIEGAVYLDGHFDEINIPLLKSVSYIKLLSTGNISCPALGAAWASVTFTPKKTDLYSGFTCWTMDENNRWNSSDPANNPTTTGSSSPSSTGSGSSSATNTKTGGASAARVGLLGIVLFSAAVLCL
ncbi:hypothetical protein GQ53DRAFT_345097 [Thozetella sp. PMI_491]|nr:hypothetical protein GQ53DRAFT_345097 [Thozetella sp. PMI_491]